MQIVDFTIDHIEQAIRIAKQNYEQERGFVPALPPVDQWPDMKPLAENMLGVAALEGGDVIGFLCSYGVWNNAWDISGLRHVYSPMGANGTIPENRARIYARLYQAAGEKWVRAGAGSHGICLYAHDTAGQEQFFRYGFGMRTVDAIRAMEEEDAPPCPGYDFCELAPEEILEVLSLENMLDGGYIESPFFMFRPQANEATFLAEYQQNQSVYFTAKQDGQTVAFIRAELDGETFIQDTQGYLHVKGAYCLPEHRGKGLHQMLLNLLIRKLKAQGYTRLGVDFESFNPSGNGFWFKHFAAYTYGVVRRVDEGAVTKVFSL